MTFIFFLKKEKNITINTSIWLLYSIIAFLGCLIYNTEIYQWDFLVRSEMTFLPLLFLYICTFIFFNSFRQVNSSRLNQIIRINKTGENILYYVNIVVMLCIIIAFRSYAFNISDFYDAYSEEDKKIVGSLTGRYDHYFFLISSGLAVTQYILPFYLLSKKTTKDTIKAIIFLIIFFLEIYIRGMTHGSRGVLFFSVFNMIFSFIFFKDFIGTKVKRTIYVLGGSVLFIIGSLAIVISQDRFGEGFVNSILDYFGETYINFPCIYWDIPEHYNGERLYALFTGQEVDTTENLNLFKTMPGGYYLDFGAFGTICFMIVYAFVLKTLLGSLRESKIYMEQVLIYTFIYERMVIGVFSNSVYSWSGYAIFFLAYMVLRLNRSKKGYSIKRYRIQYN